MKDSQSASWRTSKKKRRFFKKARIKNSELRIKEKKPLLLKKHESNFLLFLIPLILLTIFSAIYLLNSKTSRNIQKNKLVSSADTKFATYPEVINYYQPILSSKAAILMDADSKTVIFEKNPHLRFSMASTAKIMTALVALDYYQPDSILTITSGRVEGSGLNLQNGDKFYFLDLLYAMLLPSANDAAYAIADNYPGGKDEFTSKMNEKAAAFHLTDTHFSDPVGLDDDGNYTTAVDLARLGAEAMKNEIFAKVVATRYMTINNVNSATPYTFSNLNKLLGFRGVNGIKTGTTEGAGEVLVTSAIVDNHTFIIVVMNSLDRFGDTGVLLDFALDNVQFIDPRE